LKDGVSKKQLQILILSIKYDYLELSIHQICRALGIGDLSYVYQHFGNYLEDLEKAGILIVLKNGNRRIRIKLMPEYVYLKEIFELFPDPPAFDLKKVLRPNIAI